MLEQERRIADGRAAQPLPADLLERLGALGYVERQPRRRRQTPGADPKDKILEFRRANEGDAERPSGAESSATTPPRRARSRS